MNRNETKITVRPGSLHPAGALVLAVLAGISAAPAAFGQSSISRHVLPGGGGNAAAAAWSSTSTIGQAACGLSAGGGFELRGGFWGGGAANVTDAPDAVGESVAAAARFEFRFEAPAPNPARSTSFLRFELPAASPVRLRIFDVTGRLIRSMIDESFSAGRHSRRWNGDDDQGRQVATGVYFARLESTEHRATRSLLVLR